jgi:hypothetical protein
MLSKMLFVGCFQLCKGTGEHTQTAQAVDRLRGKNHPDGGGRRRYLLGAENPRIGIKPC